MATGVVPRALPFKGGDATILTYGDWCTSFLPPAFEGTQVSGRSSQEVGLPGFAKCSLVRDAEDSWPALQRLSVTPVRIHITCNAKMFRFDLALHDTPDLVVRGWLLGVTDADGQLARTDFLAADATPGDVYRWLQPVTGPDVALRLVRGAKQALEQVVNDGAPTPLSHCERFAGSDQPLSDGRPDPGSALGGRLIVT